jgi:predicted amidohydrolase
MTKCGCPFFALFRRVGTTNASTTGLRFYYSPHHGLASRYNTGMKFKIALLQITAFGDDQKKNLAKGLEACREAKAIGADLAVFPELWNIGATLSPLDPEGRRRWIASAIDQESIFFQTFASLSREMEMNIAVTYLEAHQPLPRNTVSILNRRAEIVLNYSKVFICDFGKDELDKPNPNNDDIGCDMNCSPGEAFRVCTLEGSEGQAKVGAMICADREFPEAATQLMLNGAELVIVPNACTWDENRTAGLKTRAFENLVGVAMTNYPGLSRGSSQAHSCVAWRAGRSVDTLIARAGEHEQIFLASFDLDDIRTFRRAESWRMNYRKAWHQERSNPKSKNGR